MKRQYFILIPLLLLTLISQAQLTLSKKINGKLYKLSSASNVIDSSGVRLNSDKWMSMLMSGEYDVRPAQADSDNDFIIFRLDEATINQNKKNIIQQKQVTEKSFPVAGSLFPSFVFNDIEGNTFSTDQLKGKVVLLNFWFIACKPCVQEIPELKELKNIYRKDDVQFLAITSIDSTIHLKDFLKSHPFNFNIIPKENCKESEFVKSISSYPTYFVIDKKGTLRYVSTGYTNDIIQKLKGIINSLLGE